MDGGATPSARGSAELKIFGDFGDIAAGWPKQNRLPRGSRLKKMTGASPLLESLVRSDVVVEVELVGVRAQAHGVIFALLHLDEIIDESFGEDVTLEQELVVGLERLERTL